MKGLKRAISAVIAICMIAVMLPAQIALATDEGDPMSYVKGYKDTITEVPEDYSGHIWEYEDFSSDSTKAYDYKITVYARNMTVSRFQTALSYNPADVQLVSYGSGYAYNDEDFGGDLTVDVDTNDTFFEYGTVTSDMVSSSGSSLVGQSLNTAGLFEQATAAYSQIVLNDTEYCQLFKLFSVSNITAAFTQKKWINESTGAKYETSKSPNGEEAIGYMYTLPTNQTIKLFSVFFKKVGEVDSETFKPYYNTVNKFHGGVGITTNSDKSQNFLNEGVYMAGFEKPATPDVDINYTVTGKDGALLPNAKVTLYKEASHTTQVGEATTDTNGKATISAPGSETYYYTVTMTGYQTASGTVTVGTIAQDVSSITLTKNSEVEYSLEVTVLNADNNQTVEGATVSAGSATGTTDSTGKATLALTNETYDVTAAKTGFTSGTESVTINGADSTAAVKITPNRASVTLPQVKDSSTGTAIEGAEYTVILKEGTAAAWGESKTFKAGEAAAVPAGCVFEVRLSKPADYVMDTFYAKTYSDASQAGELFSDAECSVPLTSDVQATVMGDPYYEVTVATADNETYTASVYLKNIKADYGTFGLRYNKDFFTQATFTLSDELEYYQIPAGTDPELNPSDIGAVTTNPTDGSIAYHEFTWQAKSVSDAAQREFDTTVDKKLVATYTFSLNSGMNAEDIPSDAFSVMPYDKTAAGMAYIQKNGMDEITKEHLDQLWRYCDAENDEPLGLGRLNRTAATDNGFYQVNDIKLANTESDYVMSDVETKISYEFEVKKTGLVFEVVDENGVAIKNAKVALTENGSAVETLTTDETGIASTAVDTSKGKVTYGYTVTAIGYWDEAAKTVEVSAAVPPVTVTVYEKLETKIYHEPKLVSETDGAAVNATLRGDRYAYTNRDYYFNINPNAGYKFTAGDPLTVEMNGREYTAEFDTANNMYKIPKEEIIEDPIGSKPDVEPTIDGFKSYDITIKIDPDRLPVSDEKFEVTAMAGTNGSVTYVHGGAGTEEGASPTITVKDLSSGADTGEFTFTPESGYKVEKVIVNGVVLAEYKNAAEVKYTFKNVTEDSSIIVTFWDGEHPSTDATITMVVGDKGTATVTGTPDDTLKNERKTYLFTGAAGGSISFTTSADTGYEMHKAEEELDGTRTELTGPTYISAVTAGQNKIVYVTFKAEGAEDTFTIHVKAYVAEGNGTIAPVGVLSYNKYDSPEFVLTQGGADWMATGVKLDEEEEEFDTQHETYTYRTEPLTKDIKLGAIFSEKTYKLHGKIDLKQGLTNPLTAAKPKTGATVTCTRKEGGEPVVVMSTDARDSEFTASLSKGTWTILVHKRGYLDYEITDFKVTGENADMYLGDTNNTAEAKPIIPLIGNTNGKGTVVSLSDAAVVNTAMRNDSTEMIRLKADVDDDGSVSATSDMTYVMANYGKRKISITYSEFCQ